ncbi:MAG: methionyl-tRNA formyltransferase [Planctomycetota bacterium]
MILYFGDPAGALELAARELPLVGVVLGRADAPREEELPRRLPDVPRRVRPRLDDPDVVAELAALRPSLIVSAFFPRRIPESILALAPGINVHPGPLPALRGPDPIYWAVRRGLPETELVVHALDAELDAGDVLAREATPVAPDETGGGLAARLEARGAALAAEVAARWLAGDAPAGTPQQGEVGWAPRLRRAELEVDWTRSTAGIDRFVRAASPFPGARASSLVAAPALELVRGRPLPGHTLGVPPGTLVFRDGRALVACGDGAYALEMVRRGAQMLLPARLRRLAEG